MSRTKQLQDSAVCMAIGGSDDIECPGISIVEDYFLREREENRREQGFSVDINEEHAPRSENEIRIWMNEKNMSECEQARTDREIMEYPHDWENDFGIQLPKGRNTITI